MYKRHLLGKNGEEDATEYLKKNGYTIIERNFKCKQGEIDIIAKYDEEYIFIEVKTRQNTKYGRAIDAVNRPKQKHIYYASEFYIYTHKLENKYIRFDIIEVYKNRGKHINHVKNCEFKI